MTAYELFLKFGKDLIGRVIYTERLGNCPAAMSVVTSVYTERTDAENIHVYIQHPTEKEIGVFDWETVRLVERQ
jgi:hypothetical protein